MGQRLSVLFKSFEKAALGGWVKKNLLYLCNKASSQDNLKDVNSRVAEKEREQRFLEIYEGIDAKSSVQYHGRKFKKSDVLSSSRKLMFEGSAILVQGRNRSMPVTVVVLSDILFFLQENNQKYYFFTLENKPSVIPVSHVVGQGKVWT